MALNAKSNPTYSPKRINGKFARGYSGNPGGSLEATRRSFNKDFLLALAADFKQHGALDRSTRISCSRSLPTSSSMVRRLSRRSASNSLRPT